MTDHNSLLALYREITGTNQIRIPHDMNGPGPDPIGFEYRIVQEYSYIPDYLTEG